MFKIALFFVIFVFSFLQIFFLPGKTYAQIPGRNLTESCSSKNIIITLDAPDTNLKDQASLILGKDRPFGVNVKIPDTTAQNNWQYYVVILAHPALVKEQATSFDQRIKGDNPTSNEIINNTNYRIYHWDFPAGTLSKAKEERFNVNEFTVELKHAEEAVGVIRTVGEDVCRGPDKMLSTTSNLSQVNSCPITMSDRFNSSDLVTGTVTLNSVPGIQYGYRWIEGDVSGQIPKNPLDPKPLSQIPGYNPLLPVFIGFQMDLLSPGTNISLPTKKGYPNGTYTAAVYAGTQAVGLIGSEFYLFACGVRVVTISNEATTPPTTGGGTAVLPGGGGGAPASAKICSPVDPSCTKAGGDPCDGGRGIKTAIGCVHTDVGGFVKDFLTFITAISGGLAFLMMLLGAFQMITSAGNPETLQAGKDRFSSAIIGLLMVILAVLFLKIIGVDILNLPGFTG